MHTTNLLKRLYGCGGVVGAFSLCATTAVIDRAILWASFALMGVGYVGILRVNITLIDLSHYGYALYLGSSVFLFVELQNQLMTLMMLLVTIYTRWYFGRCLFDDLSELPIPALNYGYAFGTMVVILLWRIAWCHSPLESCSICLCHCLFLPQ